LTTIVYHKGVLYTDTLLTIKTTDSNGEEVVQHATARKFFKFGDQEIVSWSGSYFIGAKIAKKIAMRIHHWLFPRFAFLNVSFENNLTQVIHINECTKTLVNYELNAKVIFKYKKYYLHKFSYKKEIFKINDGNYIAIGSGSDHVCEWHDAQPEDGPSRTHWPADAIRHASTLDEATNDDVQIIQVRKPDPNTIQCH
jgi:hypothetical protein